ncbi:sodium:solute symporter [Pseudoxanthomonas sacheonensis]|uniref:SSS family transporter n=1 Tax=Pseudoxanthomonas sacheonensis TaxID=443615 RepID=A0ABU1RVH8_9GAMM|nr:sodium:solute symporter [Pseudoxanthomonas sacheonensis]MDR6842793.1 SSS family transporter [Pseudoxanthomonas sacheonensis]
MPQPLSTMRAFLAAAFLLLCCLTLPATAASLSSVKTTSLPALAVDQPLIGLVAVEGRPIAFTADRAWVLDAEGKKWELSPWQPDVAAGMLKSAVGNGQLAFLLRGPAEGTGTASVEQIAFVNGRLSSKQLPVLPLALNEARAAVNADNLYLAGIDATGKATLLSLLPGAAKPEWQLQSGWPGNSPPTSLVAQTSAVFATVPGASGERILRWSADKGWQDKGAVPGAVVPGSARAIGQAHVIYLVASSGAAPQMMTFHTITGSWATLPDSSATGVFAAAAFDNGVLWARAGADSKRIDFESTQIESGKLLLRWLDWIVIVVYLGAMLGMGFYFYIREKRNSTSDFFVGGRSIPFWAAGVSLYAANTSSISFIAIPAKAFETNWQYLTNNLVAVLGLMFVAVWIVPLLRRLNLMSVFSYLETRFHPTIRMLASALCIIMQIGSRMSVVLFLPALAIATITGIRVEWSILMMGGFTIIYTAMGGMKAVIWTDFVQVIVKMGGAIFAILFIIWTLKGGFGEFHQIAQAADKTKLLDFSFDLTKATVWGFIFLVLFDVVLTFPKDQVLMQRTLSTKSDKEAGRSIWAFALIMIPGGFIFYSIGTALFVYYKNNPERMNPLLPIDATFPLFIAAELPMGVTGLIIAGIFAAAMATLSSIMNSVATLASVDFYEKLAKNPTPKKSVLFAEIATVATGLLGIGVALLLSRFDIHSLFDVSIELAGLLGGGFAGAYTLGMFTRRANSAGVAIGVASSIGLTLLAWSMDLVHPYFYLAISIMLCIVIGYLASLLFPAPTRDLDGLTIWVKSDSNYVKPEPARQ